MTEIELMKSQEYQYLGVEYPEFIKIWYKPWTWFVKLLVYRRFKYYHLKTNKTVVFYDFIDGHREYDIVKGMI